MSQNQQAMTGASATDSIAADMPSVPGAESAKSIIENAVHPHNAGATPASTAATPAVSPAPGTGAIGANVSAAGQQSFGRTGAVASAALDTPFTDQVIDLSIMGETLTFAKRAVVTEEVRLYKRSLTANESITDTIRRERVTVEGADVVEGADSQLDAQGARTDQDQRDSSAGVQDTLQQGTQNVQQGATEAKHGLDGMIDGAVDRLFGGHHQQ